VNVGAQTAVQQPQTGAPPAKASTNQKTQIQDPLAKLKSLLPKQETFIPIEGGGKSQGAKLFIDGTSPWTKSFTMLLGQAILTARNEIFRFELPSVTVCVFNDRLRANALMKAFALSPLDEHEWITRVGGVVIVCPVNLKGQFVAPKDEDSNYFKSTVAHQYSHCIIHLIAGDAVLPFWINEGLAMNVAGKLVPEDFKLNDYVVKSLFSRLDVLSLEELNAIPSTHGTQFDEGRTDAQQQSFHMVRLLLEQASPESLQSFLALPNADGVERAFLKAFGFDETTFHEQWSRTVKESLR
jgi:hypothetical protein